MESKTSQMNVVLTVEECKALYDLIDQLSGCNPEYVFGDGDKTNPLVSACIKIWKASKHDLP